MSFLERIIKYIAPHLCIVCGYEGKIVCDACRLSVFLPLPSACFLCNKVTQSFAVCKNCSKKTKLSYVWAFGLYGGVVKKIIHEFKFGEKRAIASVLAELQCENLPILRYDLVTFVPTATSHIRSRGFDHAELLAQEVAKQLRLPCRRLLARTTQTRQVGATRRDRIKHMEGAFRLRVHPTVLSGKRILIVDDVVSTGATLMAAGRLLKNSGAKTVGATVVARNVPR